MDSCPVRMEMDDAGSHRIVAYDKKGQWSKYDNISTLDSHGELLIAVTQYYEGVLPTEYVLVVKKVFDGGAGLVIVKGTRPC